MRNTESGAKGMGQGISCVRNGDREHGLFRSVQNGELEIVKAMVDYDPSVLCRTTVHGHLFALHVAAVHDQIQVGFFTSFFFC